MSTRTPIPTRTPHLFPLVAGLAAALSAFACSAGGGGGDVGGGGSGPGSGAGSTSGGGDDFVANPGQGSMNPVGGPDDCGGDAYRAEQAPLDIYVMFDDSGSMIPWWFSVGDVFNKFLVDPASAGIGVGIQFFGTSCDVNLYATPKVPIAPLPGNAQAIQASYPLPFDETATEPALRGAIQHARSFQIANPGHKVVVLLVTDGLPSGCNSSVESVTAVAAEGLSGAGPSIPTFVLGLGFGLDNLNRIAAAGGTGQAVIVDPNNAQALAAAMNQIRGAALPCDYALPNGGQVDPGKVNIAFAADGTNATTVPNVGTAAGCDPAGGGWYYDDPAAPSRAVTCPATCSAFKATTTGQVNVVLGCDTVIR